MNHITGTRHAGESPCSGTLPRAGRLRNRPAGRGGSARGFGAGVRRGGSAARGSASVQSRVVRVGCHEGEVAVLAVQDRALGSRSGRAANTSPGSAGKDVPGAFGDLRLELAGDQPA